MPPSTTPMSDQRRLIERDIDGYLAQQERKEILRLLTCGSVDDGKSTFIGRLLHDSQLIYEDQLAAVRRESRTGGSRAGELDLALLVDGLQAEREQGITIDVAYRYFSTAKRKFIIADSPGHEQYTRNMATGGLQLRCRDHPDRRGQRGADADPATHLHRAPARHTAPHRRREQDGPGGLRRGRLCGHTRRLLRVRLPPPGGRSQLHSHIGAARRQRRRKLRKHAVVSGPIPDVPAREHAYRSRWRHRKLPHAGAAREPAGCVLSRLQRQRGERRGAAGRRCRCAAIRSGDRGDAYRHDGRRPGGSVPAHGSYADARRPDRHQPRRRVGKPREPAPGLGHDRRDAGVDERNSDDAGQTVHSQARRETGLLPHRNAARPDRRQHPGARARIDPRTERNRSRAPGRLRADRP